MSTLLLILKLVTASLLQVEFETRRVSELVARTPRNRKRARSARNQAGSTTYRSHTRKAYTEGASSSLKNTKRETKNSLDVTAREVLPARNPTEETELTLERRMLFPLPRSPSIRTVFVPTGVCAFDNNSCLIKAF